MVDERGRVWDDQKRTGYKESREQRSKSRGLWPVKATRSRGGCLGECREKEKEEGCGFEFGQWGDRRGVGEEDWGVRSLRVVKPWPSRKRRVCCRNGHQGKSRTEGGGEGGGVFSGEGERTTETVSHTVPNMASADQFPHQSIGPEHSTTQTKIHFSFLFCGDVTRKTRTDWNLHGPPIHGPKYTGERGIRLKVENLTERAGTKAQGVIVPNPCGPCAPRY